jgi:uncharacterized protein (TIGR02421 family)
MLTLFLGIKNMADSQALTEYKEAIHELSERIVAAQRPIRILDSLKWPNEIESYFFKNKCKKLPSISRDYYVQQNPLTYDPDKKIEEFNDIDRSIRRRLGQYSGVGSIMQRMCYEYCLVVEMLKARGTPRFSEISQQLYGSAGDAFHVGAPTLKDLATLVSDALAHIKHQVSTTADIERLSSEQAVEILQRRLDKYFGEGSNFRVELSDGIIADASAGADKLKIHKGLHFSEREIRTFEVHEGWVHLGTTLNGLAQPICTFLSKGPPSSTMTQEGLAIITEIFTFSSYPGRVLRLTNRVSAVSMAEEGANFLDVYHFYRDQGLDENDSYQSTMRVFRGSLPELGPFTKDLCYSKGFILIYNFMRLAVQRGIVQRIPLLFVGKTTLEDLHILSDLLDEGILMPAKYMPKQFADLAALSAWMVYSLFLNRLDLRRLAVDFKGILQ